MEDKLRIANKVNTKYKELMNEMDENIKQAMEEIGTDEATTEALIAEHQQSSQAMVEAASASALLQPPRAHESRNMNCAMLKLAGHSVAQEIHFHEEM